MDEVKQIAYKYAVKNAFEHEGKAQMGAVVGKVKALFPEIDLKIVMPLITEALNNANKMHKDMLNSEYAKFNAEGWELKHETKEKTLAELDWVTPTTKIITRVAPNPSGAMHFGHARPSVLTDEYVKKYGGKFILRFDDTDPKVKKPVAGIEKDFIRDYNWLGVEFHETCNASDRLDRYYEIVEQLIKMDKAYICSCESELWRKLIWESKACPCRERKVEVQLNDWKKMLKHEIKEEQAVVRLKTNLDNPDPSERDWWLAKVVDVVEHPNKKTLNNHVWPSYNLASAIDDHDIIHDALLRAKDKNVTIKLLNSSVSKKLKNCSEVRQFNHGLNAFIIDGKKIVMAISDFKKQKPDYHFTIMNDHAPMATALTHLFENNWEKGKKY